MKAIIPAAGIGSRVSQITKGMSKELRLVNNKPGIEWAIEEVEPFVDEIFIILHPDKRDLIEWVLDYKEKHPQLNKISIVYQFERTGFGDAILQVDNWIRTPCNLIIVLPDMVFPYTNVSKQLVNAGHSVAVTHVDDVSSFGIISHSLGFIRYIVEKPKNVKEAPSQLGLVGRYYLPYETLPMLKYSYKNGNQEKDLTDVLNQLCPLSFVEVRTKYIDLGSP